ncbi:MAG: hypothetical protein IJO63_01385 [Bacilli bacterium]|nr:hypothetical protein [Bacilli bacterium]
MTKKKNSFKRVPWYFVLTVGFSILLLSLLIWLVISKLTTIDPESEESKALYSYLGDSNLDYCGGMVFYDDVSQDTMDNTTKLCLAYKLIDKNKISSDTLTKEKKKKLCKFTKDKMFRTDEEGEVCTVFTFSAEDLDKAYYTMFGKDIEENADFSINGIQNCFFDEEEGRYVCGASEIQTLQMGWAPTVYRVVTKVKKKNHKIYLYDNFISLNSGKCYMNTNGSIENTECTNQLKDTKKYDVDFVIDYGQKYVHVFEKNKEGNYYWISSSPVTD